ncbi:alpha/beta hydrolase [Azospirillum sp.]|uniref:alpha/beta hydrolase n=1 Tax=Azospirillum sp. TaxID=34012 RepID=UPI00262549A0|nr:alpha/beta hydrolase [Azospirillum sp.]
MGRPTRRDRRAGVVQAALLGAALLGSALPLGGCAGGFQPMGPAVVAPRLEDDRLIAADGYALPLRSWLPEIVPPRAVILALHGFNDYSNAFDGAGRRWAAQGIATYAYDQRGFGASANTGVWPGTPTLTADLKTAVAQLRRRHPDRPLFLLGESMGGAVALTALTDESAPLAVDGAILVAPAVWGRETMGALPRAALWLSNAVVPGMVVHPPRDLGIEPSDNLPMLRALGRDPLVIKGARIDALAGLTDLMDEALAACRRLDAPALILYGAHEQVLPPRPVERALAAFEASGRHVVAVYPDGYHMLLRDRQGKVVIDDVAGWIGDPKKSLLSGAERHPRKLLAAQ